MNEFTAANCTEVQCKNTLSHTWHYKPFLKNVLNYTIYFCYKCGLSVRRLTVYWKHLKVSVLKSYWGEESFEESLIWSVYILNCFRKEILIHKTLFEKVWFQFIFQYEHSVFNSAKKPFVDIKIISVSVSRVKGIVKF